MLQILCQKMRISREKLYIFIYSFKINFIDLFILIKILFVYLNIYLSLSKIYLST